MKSWIQRVMSGRRVTLPEGFAEEGDYVVVDAEEGELVIFKKIKRVIT